MGLLSALYFVQGLPFGFHATTLPVYLRKHGTSVELIGLLFLLALPWSLKALWAPFVDRHASPRFGRRRSWILPMQALLALTCLAAAWTRPTTDGVYVLLGLVFLMNLFAATMDIAVDALAVDILSKSELGLGNIAQVVGYKLGMLTGGGLLLWLTPTLGWQGLFLTMVGLIVVASIPVWLLHEGAHQPASASTERLDSYRDIFRELKKWMKAPETRWLIAFITTYKFGESMSDQMFKPFLVDMRFSPEQIGLWVGTWGMVFSLTGSFLGGVLASRVGITAAVTITAVLRVLPVAGEWWLSLGQPSPTAVVTVTCAEHFFGGALTTAVFALMMSKVDRRMGATHYTFIATLEVLGKMPPASLSGFVVSAFGYSTVFAAGTFLSFAFLGLLPRPNRRRPSADIAG
ncbi:MAG: MFS transporter [Polyangiales bacterium]